MQDEPKPDLAELGLAAFAAKDFMTALQYLEAAVSAGSSSAIVHYSLGFSFRVAGNGARAEQHFREACKLDEKEAHFRYNLGKQIGLNGDLLGALPHFADAIELNPIHPGPYYDAGSCLGRSYLAKQATVCYLLAGVYCSLQPEICPQLGIKPAGLKTALGIMEQALGDQFQVVLEDTYMMFGEHDPRTSNFLPEETVSAIAHYVANSLRTAAATAGD